MERQCVFDPSELPHGLQELYADADQWMCKFNASVTSRFSNNATCTADKTQQLQGTSKTDFTIDYIENSENTELRLRPPTLHDILVNGLLVSMKWRKSQTIPMDFCSIFKMSDDVTTFDYVLLTLVKGNRRNLFKFIRSKL